MLALLITAGALLAGGEVRDAVTGVPVPGVLVHAIGTADSVRTDAAGRWSLEAASRGTRVRFARPGYTPQELPLADTAAVTVALVAVARTREASTVTAIRGPVEAPVTQRVLARTEIERRYFGQEVPLMLAATPSVTAHSEGGAYAGYTHLRLRGIDETRINITLDGVPLNDPEDQVLYFSNFPDFGNSLQSVQVQRGVGTSSNGNAAYAGALHFESLALATATKGAEVQATVGAFDTRRASAEYTTGLLPRGFAAYGRLSGLRTDNYRHHAGNESASGFASAGWFGARTSAKLTAFGGRSKTGLSYARVDEATLRADPRANANSPDDVDDFSQRFLALSLTRLLGESGSSWSATGYHVAADGEYALRFDPATVGVFGLDHAVNGLLTTATLRRGDLALDVGANGSTYARDHTMRYEGTPGLVYLNTGHKQEASAFARARVGRGGLALFGDLQLRTAEFRYEPDAAAGVPERAIRWSFANPRAGATWQATSPLSFYLSYGRTGREPTRSDMFAGFDNVDTSNAEFVGPLSRVRPEYVNDAELGARWRTPRVAVQANLYDMRFRDEITPIGQLSYFGLPLRKNVERSARRGVEVDATFTPVPSVTIGAHATASRNRIESYVDERGETPITYRDVEPLLTPRVTSGQSLTWRASPAVTLSLQGRYQGESHLDNTGDDRFVTPASWLADAGVAFALGNQVLLVQVNNVGNERRAYTSGETDGTTSYFFVQPPRNVMVTARVRF